MERKDYLELCIRLDAQSEEAGQRLRQINETKDKAMDELARQFKHVAEDPRAFANNDPLLKVLYGNHARREPPSLEPWLLLGDYMRAEIDTINQLSGMPAELTYRYTESDDEFYHRSTIDATIVRVEEELTMFREPVIRLIHNVEGKEKRWDFKHILTCDKKPMYGGLIEVKTGSHQFPSKSLLKAYDIVGIALGRYKKS